MALASCGSDAGAPGPAGQPPYLAVVTLAQGPAEILDTARVSYHIVQLSSVEDPLDTTISRPIRDTVILSVDPSTYSVTLGGLPAQCSVRGGPEAMVVLFEGENTGLARYPVDCALSLRVEVTTAGLRPDSTYFWEISGAGSSKAGLMGANDTLYLADLTPGTYDVSVRPLRSSCIAISDGGSHRQVEVSARGGAVVAYSFLCSDPANTPGISSFAATYKDGATAFVAHVADPNRDLDGYTYQLTRCDGKSVITPPLPGRGGLFGGRTENVDSATIIGVFLADLGATPVTESCALLRVEDVMGNTTAPLQRPLNAGRGRPPEVTSFNAVLSGTSQLVTRLSVTDPDGDFVGVFVMARLLDGALGGTPDGKDDLGIYNTQGYVGASIPDLPLGGRITYGQVLSVIVYALDAEGNFTRVEDANTFQ